MKLKLFKLSVADTSATVVAVASSALFVLKKSYLDSIPAPNHALAYLGIVAEGAMASLVAGSIFFLVVNRLHEVRERAVIEPWLHKKAASVVGQFDALIDEVSKFSGVPLTHSSTETEFQKALAKIQFNSAAPMKNYAFQSITWPVYFKNRMDRSRQAISSLVDRLRFLTADEARNLSELEDHHLFYVIDTLIGLPTKPTSNLGFLASSFTSFAEVLMPLRSI